MISKFFENFQKSQNFRKFSKMFEDQLWEDLTFFVFNRFWISFFIDRSEIPWRTRFFYPKVFKKHRKKVVIAPVTNREIPSSVSLFWGRPAAGQLPGSLLGGGRGQNLPDVVIFENGYHKLWYIIFISSWSTLWPNMKWFASQNKYMGV